MSESELFVDIIDQRLHGAITVGNTLDDLYADAQNETMSWGTIHLGLVTKIDTKLDAAVVDLGTGHFGYLPAKHVHFPGGDGIASKLKAGQLVPVQIKSEAKNFGFLERDKMPRLTTKLYVMGHHLAYCPVFVTEAAKRNLQNRLVRYIESKTNTHGDWILQPFREKTDPDVLLAEAKYLMREWNRILAKQKELGKNPGILKDGPTALERVLFDYGTQHFAHIHVGSMELLKMMEKWCAVFEPALATSKRLRLFKPDKPEQRLFDTHDIYSVLETLQDKSVPLPSGGSIIIEETHALLVVDVNQGNSPSPMTANEEAAGVFARQARLRNYSGGIIVDCINMPQRAQRTKVLEAFEKHFEGDIANGHVHGFTRLGIIEITRKRRAAFYAETLQY